MTKKPKLSKISIVVFLTVLIWVWADLAQDETLPLRNLVTISLARSSDLWMTFEGPEGTLQNKVTLEVVELTGPASRVAEVRRMQNEGDLELDLFLTPDQVGLTESGTQGFDVLNNLLKQSDEISQLGLTVENCEPRNLTVQVRKLATRRLAVECFDQDNNPIGNATIEPPIVEGRVPQEGVYTARVQLTSPAEQQRARGDGISRQPTVVLAPGHTITVDTPVTITLPPQTVVLEDYRVRATLGFCFSPNLQGQYRVVQDPNRSLPELPTVNIRATENAYRAYDEQDFKVILYVLDEDREAMDWIPREIECDFPEQFVRHGEIEVNDDFEPLVAYFRLVSADEYQEIP